MFFTSENFRESIRLYVQRLPAALWVTVYVTIGAVAIGIALGLILAILRLLPIRPLARAGLARGPRILKTVGTPSSLRVGIAYFIAG